MSMKRICDKCKEHIHTQDYGTLTYENNQLQQQKIIHFCRDCLGDILKATITTITMEGYEDE